MQLMWELWEVGLVGQLGERNGIPVMHNTLGCASFIMFYGAGYFMAKDAGLICNNQGGENMARRM